MCFHVGCFLWYIPSLLLCVVLFSSKFLWAPWASGRSWKPAASASWKLQKYLARWQLTQNGLVGPCTLPSAQVWAKHSSPPAALSLHGVPKCCSWTVKARAALKGLWAGGDPSQGSSVWCTKPRLWAAPVWCHENSSNSAHCVFGSISSLWSFLPVTGLQNLSRNCELVPRKGSGRNLYLCEFLLLNAL